MQFKTYLFFCQWTWLCNFLIFSNGKPLVGENVRQAVQGEFPFIVSIGLVRNNNTGYAHFCTGALVSNRDVLTTAHCLKNVDIQNVRVKIGSIDIRQGRIYVPAFWLNYRQWCNRYGEPSTFQYNDIAMMRLTEYVSQDVTQPGVLSDLRNHQFVHFDVSLAGWGRRFDNTRPVIMETADVTVMELQTCNYEVNQISGRQIDFPLNLFCTKANPPILAHRGDSGGPVLYMNTIVGITQQIGPFPHEIDNPGNVNIHIGIFYYKNFILGFIAI